MQEALTYLQGWTPRNIISEMMVGEAGEILVSNEKGEYEWRKQDDMA